MSTYIEYTGDGTTQSWSVPFTKLDQAVVKVNVDGVEQTGTFNNGFVSIPTAPSAGAKILIFRETPREPLGNFEEGAKLVEDDLNLLWDQCLDVAEEGFDLLARENAVTLGVVDGLQDALDALPDLTPAGLLAAVKTVDGPSSGLYAQNADIANRATRLNTGRTITLTGEVTGVSQPFDGQGNVTINTTIPNPPAELTGAQILAKLLAVDGPGSLLNADTVDGYQAANLLKAVDYSYDTTGPVGFIKFPQLDLKIIWGEFVTTGAGNTNVTFSHPFTSTCFFVDCNVPVPTGNADRILSKSANGFTYSRYTATGGTLTGTYFAIGK